MSGAEWLLERLSRPYAPQSDGRPVSVHEKMRELRDLYPGISFGGQRVVDFGCGAGAHAIGMALEGATVVGIDVHEAMLVRARARAAEQGVSDRVRFVTAPPAGERFDIVLSNDSMEHFANPAAVLAMMRAALEPDGRMLVSFSPPWLSAYGAHMHFFTKVPWVHLLFPERVVMRVRSRYRSDGAERYEDVEGGLNRMTLRKYERLVREAGLQFARYELHTTKRLPIVEGVPLLRELLVSRVVSVLRRPMPREGVEPS